MSEPLLLSSVETLEITVTTWGDYIPSPSVYPSQHHLGSRSCLVSFCFWASALSGRCVNSRDSAAPATALERRCLHRENQELGKHRVDGKEVLGEGRWEAWVSRSPASVTRRAASVLGWGRGEGP